MEKNRKQLEGEIIELLKSSGIPLHEKAMTKILLPVMEIENLENILETLKTEKQKLDKLDKKAKRLEFKYKMVFDRISK